MKPLLLFGLLLVGHVTLAQTPARTKFYFCNQSYPVPMRLQTDPNVVSDIKIGKNGVTLIETDADSLISKIGNQAFSFSFTKGQSYYFIVGQSTIISEVTERPFWIAANLYFNTFYNNDRSFYKYFLRRDGSVQQLQ